MEPLIGITVNYQNDDHVARNCGLGVAGQDFNYIAEDYVTSVERAGGVPLLIPQSCRREALTALLEKLDGVVLSGGHDVDPALYGEKDLYCGTVSKERDDQDLFVARYALRRDLPLLAICRGIQILNVALGGTLFQDVEKQAGAFCHRDAVRPRNEGWHTVSLAEGSRLRKIFGKPEICVNSYHHQAVRTPGTGASIVSRASDGVPEAIEIADKRFAVGVQWHPEMMYDSEEQLKLFRALVEASLT